jgi:hypothetical protein
MYLSRLNKDDELLVAGINKTAISRNLARTMFLKWLVGFILIMIVLCKCQIPYEHDVLDAGQKIPVVEGYLNNTDGPHSISIYYARPYNSVKYDQVSGAVVYITDGNGNKFMLHEESPGKYSTLKGQLTGIIGETYLLNIELPGGEKIKSRPEILPDPIEIDSAYINYNYSWTEIVADASGKPVIVNRAGLGLFAVIRNIREGRAYYRISSKPIEHYMALEPISNEIITDSLGDSFSLIHAHVHHWYSISNTVELPRIGRLIAGGNYSVDDLTNLAFRFINCDDGGRCPGDNCDSCLVKEWIIPFQVYSISSAMYQLYEDQLSQLNAPDRIYDPIPRQITGNLFTEEDKERPVLGMFEVSALSRLNLAIEVTYFFNYDYLLRTLPDTLTLPQKSGYRYGGVTNFLIPIDE